jgi:cysteine synthase A
VGILRREAAANHETPLIRFPLPESWNIQLYLKDESRQPTGSLKHRLAHALFIEALVSGRLNPQTTILEASSGSTAVSEAYFAQLLGLPFVAVMPGSTSPEKIARVEQYDGRAELVDDPSQISTVATRLADELHGYHMDQFLRASAVTDWQSDSSLTAEILRQLRTEPHPIPRWMVVGVGTGGTSTAIGRYCRSNALPTSVAAVDPEGSAYFDAWRTGEGHGVGSRIEGIGRPGVEASFTPSSIDAMLRVPDAQSIAATHLLADRGISAGGSTGTNLVGALRLIAEMLKTGAQGSVVTLICDGADRYQHSYFNEEWIRDQGLDLEPHRRDLEGFLSTGEWTSPDSAPTLLTRNASSRAAS